jgi:hypothetical protein
VDAGDLDDRRLRAVGEERAGDFRPPPALRRAQRAGSRAGDFPRAALVEADEPAGLEDLAPGLLVDRDAARAPSVPDRVPLELTTSTLRAASR